MFIIKNKKTQFEMKKGYVSKAGNTLIGYYYLNDGVEFAEDGKGHYIENDLIAIFHKFERNCGFDLYFEVNFGDTAEASGLSLQERLQCKEEVEEWECELDTMYYDYYYEKD